MHDKMLWFNPNIQFLFHGNIVEYDMSKASLSVCERFGLLDKNEIERMKLLPKLEREICMGKHQKNNKEFSNQLLEGIREIRRKFLEANGLDESNIMSLHNDACIFNSRKKIVDTIDGIKFHHDNTWCGYMRYGRAEIFYGENSDGSGFIDIKNVPKDIIHQHTFGLNKYLMKVFGYIENYDMTVFKYVSKFNKQYLQDKLPEYYYFPFGKAGNYKNTNLELFAVIADMLIKEVKTWKYSNEI